MKKFIIFLIFIVLAITSSIVFAQYTPQSSPGFTGGGTLWGRTAAQVNQYFQNKVDALSGTAYGLTLSQPSVLDTMSFQGTYGNVLTTQPGSNVNIGGSLSVTGNTKFNGALTAPNILNGQIGFSATASLTAAQSGSYVFWNGTSPGTITLPNSQSFATVGGGIFYIQNNGTATVSIATVSTDYNNLPGAGNKQGGSAPLAPGQSVLVVANPGPPGWQSLQQNIFSSPITAPNVLGGFTLLTSSTTLLPSQSGQYIFWQSTSAGTITLPKASSFASIGYGIFFIINTSQTNVTIQTQSTDYNFLVNLSGSQGGSVTLASGQNIIAIANPKQPAWFGGYQNIMPSLQTTGNITANNNITATGTITANNILSNHMVNVTHVISQDVPSSITTTTGTTLSAGVLLDGAILRSGPTAAFTDTLDSASNIVTRIFNPLVNNTFDFTIVNYTPYTMTLAMGTGGTLASYPSGVSGSPGTIPANNSVKFRLVITNVSTPSYAVYRISSGGV